MQRPSAILLLGPTGSGKTPLGELMERRGFGGRRCRHFDLGDRLRRFVQLVVQVVPHGQNALFVLYVSREPDITAAGRCADVVTGVGFA